MDGAYVINLDQYSDIGTHWIALYVSKASPKDVKNNDITYFDRNIKHKSANFRY